MEKPDAKKFINYSEVSRHLTGDRMSIRSTYKGRKYKNPIKSLIDKINSWIEKDLTPFKDE